MKTPFSVIVQSLLISISLMVWRPGTLDAQLQRSSNHECTICHVMWMDAFKGDLRTLIESGQSSVVVAGLQGVVSSEEMCYSCHDGYVEDSRMKLWSGDRHKIGVPLPRSMESPGVFHLDINKKIYCGTCHGVHNVPDETGYGFGVFLRMKNDNSMMCRTCHKPQEEENQTIRHPLDVAAGTVPRTFLLDGAVMGTGGKIVCQTCHTVHGGDEHLLIYPGNRSLLCMTCHPDHGVIEGTDHDFHVTAPGIRNTRGETLAAAGLCGICHFAHHGNGRYAWAQEMKTDQGQFSDYCTVCHSDGKSAEKKTVGSLSHPVSAENFPGLSDLPIPLYDRDGARDPDGRVYCSTCHDPHRWFQGVQDGGEGVNADGDAYTSFLRVANDREGTLCVTCHRDKLSISLSDHSLMKPHFQSDRLRMSPFGEDGQCSLCHVVHNGRIRSVENNPHGPASADDAVTALCLACHSENGPAREKAVGQHSHPVTVPSTADGEGKESLPLFDRKGVRNRRGLLTCATCHNPHRWSEADSMLVLSRENIHGDARTSFLRRQNAPSPDLCVTCHDNQRLVQGTPHDLSVQVSTTGSDEQQRIREEGLCGPCHAVHQSNEESLLWARAFGPGTTLQEQMCFGCHRQDGCGEKKIPQLWGHPASVIVSRRYRLTVEGKEIDFPLASREWPAEKTGQGWIDCLTCHNPHQWTNDPSLRSDPDATTGNSRTSFLRNKSYDTLCADCHGPETVIKYQYFHSPKAGKGTERKSMNEIQEEKK